MFCAVRAGAPRRIVYDAWSLAAAFSTGLDSFGTGLVVPLAGSAALASGRGLATGAAGFAAFASGAPFDDATARRRRGAGAGAALGSVEVGGDGLGEGGGAVAVAVDVRWSDAWTGLLLSPPGGDALKYATQTGSTLWGSRWYWSNISSTNHSLAPRSLEGWPSELSDGLPEGCGTAGFASSSDACE